MNIFVYLFMFLLILLVSVYHVNNIKKPKTQKVQPSFRSSACYRMNSQSCLSVSHVPLLPVAPSTEQVLTHSSGVYMNVWRGATWFVLRTMVPACGFLS